MAFPNRGCYRRCIRRSQTFWLRPVCVSFARQNSSEGVQFGTDMFGQAEGTGGVACGMMLLGLYLVFDSFTSQWQSRMFTKHRVRTTAQMVKCQRCGNFPHIGGHLRRQFSILVESRHLNEDMTGLKLGGSALQKCESYALIRLFPDLTGVSPAPAYVHKVQ